MEIYNGGKESTNDGKKPFFPPSLLNFRTPTWEKFCFFLLGFLGLQLFSLIISSIINIPVSAKEISADFANTLVMFFSYLLMVVGFVLFLTLDKRKSYKTVFSGFKDPFSYAYAALTIVAVMATNYIFNLLYSVIPGVKDLYTANANQSGITSEVTSSPLSAVLMFFVVVFFAPFSEELTYRVGIVDVVGKKHRWVGIILSALIFGLIHFSFSTLINAVDIANMDPGSYEDWMAEVIEADPSVEMVSYTEALTAAINALKVELLNLPLYVLPGFFLAFFYAKSGKITTTMMAHMTINLISFVEIVIQQAVTTAP